MKRTVTIYRHRNNGKEYELIPELMQGEKVCLQDKETEEHKFYSTSTLKKNFTRSEVEVEIEVPKAEEQPTQLRANLIVRDNFHDMCAKEEIGATIKETNSYIGISYKKSCAQVVFTKKRLTVSVNKEEFFHYLESVENKPNILELVDKCFYKEAPAKYGWRMDFEIDVTDLTNQEIAEILKTAVEARMFTI